MVRLEATGLGSKETAFAVPSAKKGGDTQETTAYHGSKKGAELGSIQKKLANSSDHSQLAYDWL